MHWLHVVTLLVVLMLVGVELSVSAFVNPSAWRLAEEPQLRLLSHFAAVLGRVMPFWYALSIVLLGAETSLHRATPAFAPLLTASVLWVLTSGLSFVLLVPLNNRVAEGAAGWQQLHRTWDTRHRVRVCVLVVAAALLASALVR